MHHHHALMARPHSAQLRQGHRAIAAHGNRDRAGVGDLIDGGFHNLVGLFDAPRDDIGVAAIHNRQFRKRVTHGEARIGPIETDRLVADRPRPLTRADTVGIGAAIERHAQDGRSGSLQTNARGHAHETLGRSKYMRIEYGHRSHRPLYRCIKTLQELIPPYGDRRSGRQADGAEFGFGPARNTQHSLSQLCTVDTEVRNYSATHPPVFESAKD